MLHLTMWRALQFVTLIFSWHRQKVSKIPPKQPFSALTTSVHQPLLLGFTSWKNKTYLHGLKTGRFECLEGSLWGIQPFVFPEVTAQICRKRSKMRFSMIAKSGWFFCFPKDPGSKPIKFSKSILNCRSNKN